MSWLQKLLPPKIQRIAAPMVGGMITAPLLSMFVIPAAYLLLRRREIRAAAKEGTPVAADKAAPMAAD